MEPQHLYIKNMVCDRCIKVVKEELQKLGHEVTDIKLGEAVIEGKEIDLEKVKAVLELNGFELLEDKKNKLIDKVKSIVIDLIHHKKATALKGNYSEYIAKQVGKDYAMLSSLFSSLENITIEKFIILQKVERVKELLIYDEHNLSEIADMMNYSSPAHMSSQFKQVTGLSPSEFKKLKSHSRNPLDKLGNQ